MASVEMQCHCGEIYTARSADLKRGWGYSCGKSCAAKRRDFGLKKAKRLDGLKTKQVNKTPSSYRPNDQRAEEWQLRNDPLGWYANQIHPFSSEGLGQD